MKYLIALAFLASSQNAFAADVLFVTGMANEAAIANGPGARVVIGAGNAGGLRATLNALPHGSIKAVVSFGIAGALSPASRPGDLIFSKSVVSPNGEIESSPALLAALHRILPAGAAGRIFASDTIVTVSSAQRAALRARTGAVSCDTESAIAAEFARERGVPFIAIRAVADTSDINFPPAALLPLKADGTPDGSAIAWSLMSNPGQIPLLTTLAQDEKAALASLQKARAAMNLSSF